jgi:putative two-component system response regulator
MHVGVTDHNTPNPLIVRLVRAIRYQEAHVSRHSRRVHAMAMTLGRRLSLDLESLDILAAATLFHDLGKFLIPQPILNKRGPLTRREWAIMREHPDLGRELCRALPWLHRVVPVIAAHHERLDGGGYPEGLSGSRIPLLAQITQLADVTDALLSARAYKPPFPLHRTLEILHDEAQRGWRDRTLTDEWVRVLTVGSTDTAGGGLPASARISALIRAARRERAPAHADVRSAASPAPGAALAA